jgi:hypothetical protein
MSEFSAAAAVPASGEPIAPLKSRLSRGALAWILQQGARDPYVILITIYIFSPYFSRVLVGDPVQGQAVVANISTIYGLLTALTAPLIGAMIEQYGPRKPMLGLTTAVMVPAHSIPTRTRPSTWPGYTPSARMASMKFSPAACMRISTSPDSGVGRAAATARTSSSTPACGYSIRNAIAVSGPCRRAGAAAASRLTSRAT